MTEEKKITEEATEAVVDQQTDDVVDAAEIMEETTEEVAPTEEATEETAEEEAPAEEATEETTEEETPAEEATEETAEEETPAEEPAEEEIADAPLPTGARICVALTAVLGTALITHIIMTVVSLIAG